MSARGSLPNTNTMCLKLKNYDIVVRNERRPWGSPLFVMRCLTNFSRRVSHVQRALSRWITLGLLHIDAFFFFFFN